MSRLTITILVAAISAVQPAHARDFTLLGAGKQSCGTWVQNRREAPLASYQDQSWVFGFLSGLGSAGLKGIDPLNGMDAAGVAAWIDNYCKSNPIDALAKATIAFVSAHPQ